jgi:glycosyltransferase involved in cell wall biosynthesis
VIDPSKPNYANRPNTRATPGAWAGDASTHPAVSIVTAFYNTDAIFEETAACVFAQTLQNFEWLIINDGSSAPEALAILAKYRALGDSRVRVLDMPVNSGPSATRNMGFRHARAEIVYQLDSDDLIEPTTLEKHVWFLRTRPKMAFAASHEVGFEAQEYLWPWGFHTPDLFLKHCPIGAHTVAVRKSVHEAVGGYDESIRGGMEDWDFWLRCASQGHWGGTIPEHLTWYRRRGSHATRWSDWDGGPKQQLFFAGLQAKYPSLFQLGMPRPPVTHAGPFDVLDVPAGLVNPLKKSKPRLLMLVPWFQMGGADKYNRRVVEQLVTRGWDVSLVATLRGDNGWLPEFAKLTPDVFALHHFLQLEAFPAFIQYLLESRRPDAVLVTNSELGYWLLPFMRAHHPGAAYLDYVHMEEDYWKSGGYPRYTAGCSDELDQCIVSSEHLKRWVVSRGGRAEAIAVCTTNEDTQQWRPHPEWRARVREELKIPEDRAVLIYAGRICAQKQPRVFARTILALREQGLEFVALVAGDGADRPMLEAMLAGQIADGSVRMLGAVPNARMQELYAASDIFFLPSQWEGISLAVYEAMASGLAIIGADVGGQIEVVTPETGVLIPRSDETTEAAAYASHLASVIRDRAKREAMGQAGRARIVEHFPLDAMGARMDQLIRDAMRNAGEGSRGVISARTAREVAARAVEFVRVHDLADHLWVERERLAAQLGSALVPPYSNGTLDGHAHDPVATELAQIEHSFAWRTMTRLKGNPLYAIVARARWGPNWNMLDADEPANVRLARLKNSRSYRLILGIKATGVYRKYARMKYGPK